MISTGLTNRDHSNESTTMAKTVTITTTALPLDAAITAYGAQATIAADGAFDLALRGAICLVIGCHLQPKEQAAKPSDVMATMRKAITDERTVKQGKEEKTIKTKMLDVYSRAINQLYVKVTNDGKSYGGAVQIIATAKTVDDAFAGLKAWVSQEMTKTGEQKNSLNALSRFLGLGVGNNTTQKKPIERFEASLKSATDAIQKGNIKPEQMAKALTNIGVPNMVPTIVQMIGTLEKAKAYQALMALDAAIGKALEAVAEEPTVRDHIKATERRNKRHAPAVVAH